MVFLVGIFSTYCFLSNFNLLYINEEFIISIVLIFFIFSLISIIKTFLITYFLYKKEILYFFYSYLLNLNVNLLDKLIYFITLATCRQLMNIVEVYNIFLLFTSNAVHVSYNNLFSSLRFHFMHTICTSYTRKSFKKPIKLNLTYHFFICWLKHIESLDNLSIKK